MIDWTQVGMQFLGMSVAIVIGIMRVQSTIGKVVLQNQQTEIAINKLDTTVGSLSEAVNELRIDMATSKAERDEQNRRIRANERDIERLQGGP